MDVLEIPSPSTLSPLVFLHEGLGSIAMWQGRTVDWPLQVCRAAGRAGWVYSRRGYGQSPAIPDVRGTGRLRADYMHREAWEVLPSLLKDWGAENPVLIGHSDGATIALLHAARFPVAGCVVMAPHLLVEDMTISAIAASKNPPLEYFYEITYNINILGSSLKILTAYSRNLDSTITI
jgi:pimeloyl-ACP methyl ester carboxylesterase